MNDNIRMDTVDCIWTKAVNIPSAPETNWNATPTQVKAHTTNPVAVYFLNKQPNHGSNQLFIVLLMT